MVDTADQIIVVEAAVSKDSKPMLNFVYADDKTKPVEEVKSGESGSLIQIEELDQVFHFAVEGRSWTVIQKHYPEILPKVNQPTSLHLQRSDRGFYPNMLMLILLIQRKFLSQISMPVLNFQDCCVFDLLPSIFIV